MDFVDFESLNLGDDLPQPQPALSLPIASNIETFGRKFYNLNLLTRTLLNRDPVASDEKSDQQPQTALKYASMSLLMLEDESGPEKTALQATSATQTSALSARLARVLNSPLSDTQIRDIFGSLDDTLRSQESVLDTGTVGSMLRRKLRGEIERTLIHHQNATLKQYQPVVKALLELESRVADLQSAAADVVRRVGSDFESSARFNQRMLALYRRRTVVVLKKHMLTAFRDKFTLNEYEQHTLEHGDINDDFFAVLARAELVDANCAILLSIDNSQLGVKTMARVNLLVTRALEKVVAYANRTLGNLYAISNRDRVRTLHRCLVYLRQKPPYFDSVVSQFVAAQSRTLVDEFHARAAKESRLADEYQDPVRVIGDLLAHIHAVVVGESETLAGVFLVDAESVDPAVKADLDRVLAELVARVLQALAKPVRAKLEQIISREIRVPVLFSIHNLVQLYHMMFAKQIQQDHMGLVQTIDSLVRSAEARIVTTVENKLATVRGSNLAQLQMNVDLQPPEWIIDFYADILPALDHLRTDSIFASEDGAADHFTALVVDEVIDIYETHMQTGQVNTFSKRDKLMLQLNCLDLVLSKIMPVAALADKVIYVNDKIRLATDQLVQMQTAALLLETGLTDFHNIANMVCPVGDDFFDVSIYQPMTENKLFTADAVRDVNHKIQQFLPSALLDIQQALFKINSPLVVNDIISESAAGFARFYGRFLEISQEFLGVPLVWSEAEVATLLGVE